MGTKKKKYFIHFIKLNLNKTINKKLLKSGTKIYNISEILIKFLKILLINCEKARF